MLLSDQGNSVRELSCTGNSFSIAIHYLMHVSSALRQIKTVVKLVGVGDIFWGKVADTEIPETVLA